jgi:hypothetical protein
MLLCACLTLTNYIVLLLCSCDSIPEEEIKIRLDQNLKSYCSALKDFNSNRLIRYFPPSLIESFGGEEDYHRQFLAQEEEFYNNGMSYKEVTSLNPIKFKMAGKTIHSIAPIKTIVYTPENIMTSNAFLYCYSEDYGENWVIMDYEALKSFFPEFKFKFHPDSEVEMIKETCQYVKIDAFGKDVCIDRFIESGKYLIESSDGRKVYKVVKNEKAMTLDVQQLMLIDTAIISWINKKKTKYNSLEIKKYNARYLESEIGGYYLYDIYAVPFTHKVNGKITQDTLIGFFSIERDRTYQSTENIKEITRGKNEFIIVSED